MQTHLLGVGLVIGVVPLLSLVRGSRDLTARLAERLGSRLCRHGDSLSGLSCLEGWLRCGVGKVRDSRRKMLDFFVKAASEFVGAKCEPSGAKPFWVANLAAQARGKIAETGLVARDDKIESLPAEEVAHNIFLWSPASDRTSEKSLVMSLDALREARVEEA